MQKQVKVIAVDQSPEMLHHMAEKFKGNELLICLQGEAEHIPIGDNTVDYCMANMFLHHVADPLVAIREMVRILKPQGKLVITDMDEHAHEFLKSEQYDIWMGFKRIDVQRWFLEAGLKNVRVDCAGETCCAESSCGSDIANVSIFVAYGEK